MNPLRRIAAQLNVSVDSFLDQIENHEAVASRAIYEIKVASGKARTQYFKVKNDSEKMRSQIAEAERERKQWVERAKRIHSQDENKALECVKRIHKLDEQLKHLQVELDKNAQAEKQLAQDLRQIEDELDTLKRRRNTLASRQANAEAIEAVHQAGNHSFREIDDIFERWEARVAGKEGYRWGVTQNTTDDELKSEFVAEEEAETLKAKLSDILKKEDNQ